LSGGKDLRVKKESDNREQNWDDRVSLEATEWIARRDRGLTGEEQDRFFEWLNEDERHREMYRRRLSFWKRSQVLSDWRPGHSEEPNPDLFAAKPQRALAPVLRWAIAAALAIVGLGAFFLNRGGEQGDLMADFGTAEGYANHTLADGSIVEMNRGARVSAHFTKDRRLVFLHEGEAHFTVAKDRERPFSVRAGDALVEATGTAFNVALKDDGLEVLVTEGKVRLNSAPVGVGGSAEEPRQSVLAELVAGQRSVLAGDAQQSVSKVEKVSADEMEERLSWKGEILDFTDEPLSEVIAAFNQRNYRKLSITDPRIQDLEITAKLKSNNLDGFLELLAVTMDVEAVESEEGSRILLVSSN